MLRFLARLLLIKQIIHYFRGRRQRRTGAGTLGRWAGTGMLGRPRTGTGMLGRPRTGTGMLGRPRTGTGMLGRPRTGTRRRTGGLLGRF
jgi:hypothetical protein